MGVTFASFHSLGTLPEVRDLLKIMHKGLQIMVFTSLRILGDILSGPGDLFVLSLLSARSMSFSMKVKVSMYSPSWIGVFGAW